jgi:hypothetical protein
MPIFLWISWGWLTNAAGSKEDHPQLEGRLLSAPDKFPWQLSDLYGQQLLLCTSCHDMDPAEVQALQVIRMQNVSG